MRIDMRFEVRLGLTLPPVPRKMLTVKVTADEMDRINRLAAAVGCRRSTFLRAALEAAALDLDTVRDHIKAVPMGRPPRNRRNEDSRPADNGTAVEKIAERSDLEPQPTHA